MEYLAQLPTRHTSIVIYFQPEPGAAASAQHGCRTMNESTRLCDPHPKERKRIVQKDTCISLHKVDAWPTHGVTSPDGLAHGGWRLVR